MQNLTIGLKLRQLRRQANVSSYVVAEKLGASVQYVCRQESKVLNPSPKFVAAYLDALDIPTSKVAPTIKREIIALYMEALEALRNEK